MGQRRNCWQRSQTICHGVPEDAFNTITNVKNREAAGFLGRLDTLPWRAKHCFEPHVFCRSLSPSIEGEMSLTTITSASGTGISSAKSQVTVNPPSSVSGPSSISCIPRSFARVRSSQGRVLVVFRLGLFAELYQ